MIHFDLPKEKSSIIKVIGVGGGGSNAVNHMHAQQIDGVNFIICNTDAQAIAQSAVPNKVQLGPHLTQGLGAGANPEIGRQATEESMEEIRRILEVNTKMAFITAGMGGGTGTGGAPIIAKVCKDLGILTVGIVTTPFGYEGKKRIQQAVDGIERLRQYVDTLLVISNDKLRHQFGNLKMKEAFSRADNVLATAAKCITDVINTTGQINVDFADVCTVMRNGGVAILGNAAANGENRAQRAIEEALNSPLLNDNDIRGAKWILININSAEGDHEFTMDEVDIIQSHILEQAGEDTDVILGLGYDAALGDKIGITLIATGFEQKSPFEKPVAQQPAVKQEPEKIMLVLGQPEVQAASKPEGKPEMKCEVKAEEKQAYSQPALFQDEAAASIAPVLVDPAVTAQQPAQVATPEPVVLPAEPARIEWVLDIDIPPVAQTPIQPEKPAAQPVQQPAQTTVSGGYLTRPANIYATENTASPVSFVQEPPAPPKPAAPEMVQPIAESKPEEEVFEMKLIEKQDEPVAVQEPVETRMQMPVSFEPPVLNEEEDLRRKALDRVQKLRNLSFSNFTTDANNEFDTVPAYLRRNLELYNTISPAENFYSNYTVQSDEQSQVNLNTLNTFLEGKKPD